MEDSIYQIFLKLQTRENADIGCFSAASLPFANQHKIGISSEGFPLFFIECDGNEHSLDIDLELISVQFNRKCRIKEGDCCDYNNVFTVLLLKTNHPDFQRYFIEVVCLVLKKMTPNPSHKQIKNEIQKLVELFSRLTQLPKKTVQGLWAELFIIDQSENPEYLIQSWHSVPEDKFDFNDGNDKVEVKSTSKPRRNHHFAYEQLNPNKNSNLVVASIIVNQTGRGKSIYDLKESICNKISNVELQFRLNDIIVQTLGNNIDGIFDLYYDYQQAIDSLKYYDVKDIPNISKDQIPVEISNIHFECDLSTVCTIKAALFDTSKSPLFKSIIR